MIPESIVHLLQTGVSVVVGTRDPSLVPECTRAWGIHVGKGRDTVTIFLSETFAGKTIANLRHDGRVAITCARPTDHISCQLKGQVQSIKPLTSRQRETSQRRHREFVAELRAIGVAHMLTDAWIVEPTVAVEIGVTHVFDQTPGPGAGKKVEQ